MESDSFNLVVFIEYTYGARLSFEFFDILEGALPNYFEIGK